MTDDMTFMTTDSATIGTLLNADGTCAKHPHVRLRERDEDGNVYQRDSCPECDRELAVHRKMLKQRRAELDRQLQELEVTAEEEAQQQQMEGIIPSLNGMNGGMSSGMSMMSGLDDPHLGLLTSASFEQQFQSSVQKYVSQDDLQGLRETVAQYGAAPAPAPSVSSSSANFNNSNHQQQQHQQQQQQQQRSGGAAAAASMTNPYGPSLTSPSAATSGLPPMSSALYALPPMVSYPGAPPLPGSGPSSFAPTSYQQQQQHQQQQQQHRGPGPNSSNNPQQQQQQQQHHGLPPMEQDQGYMRTLDGLSVQMQRMQQMQDWLLMQKEQEVVLLRQRCEEQQKLLIEKEVENALLKQKLQQQEQRMQHELKLIKLAAFGRAVQRNRVDVVPGMPPAVVMGNTNAAAAGVGPNMNNNNNYPPSNSNNSNNNNTRSMNETMGNTTTTTPSGVSPPLQSQQMQQQKEQQLQQQMQHLQLQQQQVQQQQMQHQQQQQQYLSAQQANAAAAATAAAAMSYQQQQQQQQRPSTMDRIDFTLDDTDLDDHDEEKKDIFNAARSGAPSTAAAAAASYRPETASATGGGTTMSWTSESLKTSSTSRVTPNVNNNTRDVEDSKVAAAASATTAAMNEAASVNSGSYTDIDEESSKDLVLYKPPATAAAMGNNYNHTNSIGKSEESSSGFGDEDRDQFTVGAAPWEQQAMLARAPSGPGVARTFQALNHNDHYHHNDVEDEEDDVELTKAAAAEEEEDDKYYGGGGVPKTLNLDQGALPEVPLEEGITMGTFATSAPQLSNRFKDRFPVQEQDADTNEDEDEADDKARELNAPPSSSDRFTPKYLPKVSTEEAEPAPAFLDDNRSLGNTVASSTYGEDRQKVVNQTLLDPYGDKGIYTGIVLRSTGMPHGLGRMKYEEDGRIYEGDWRHGRWHGYGRASFSNGDRYEGEYRFDQRHGKGIYRWNDGRVYDGNFSEDKRHGKGIFTWPDGARYDGEFVHGQREGFGVYVFCDGGKYEGSWKDGRYDGFGTCTWEDGRCYRGEWRNGMAHGRGVETYPDGRVRHDGQWINDEPIR